MKLGKKVARSCWNDLQYVVAQGESKQIESTYIWNPHNKAHAEKLGGYIDVAPYCTLKTVQDTLAMGWTPSTGDLFANDWLILEQTIMLNTEKQITLQLDPTNDTTGNAEQVARMIGVSAWHISGDYLVVENPLLDYRVTNNETYSHKTDRIPNGAVVILVQEEPKTVEQQIEQEIQSKNLNAPRLTPDHIDSKIKAVEYILPRDVCKRDNGVEVFDAPLPLQTLTFCILTLENGFTVTGESACASPENFDAEIGKKIAYDNAREKIWLLEGYLLKEKLNHQIKIQEHFASQGVDAGKLQDSPIVSELPELEIKYSDAVKSTDPTNDNQACVSGSVGECIHRTKLLNNRENSYLLTQLLSLPNINNDLRKKAETKMTALLDELI